MKNLLAFIFTTITAISEAVASDQNKKTCCQLLQKSPLQSIVFGPTAPAYNQTIQAFWSGQARDDSPSCVVQPKSANDVAATVKLLSGNNCQFSVKSGGHTAWPGASSIDGGITIDMAQISQVTVSNDKNVATVGSGARWGDVYEALIPQGLMVAGGRASSVGVGGLILGGGYSWFAPVSGFVVDSVLNIEIVLADGSIINANKTAHSDLFRVLKGGGNNFGVVTRFDLAAFQQGDMWGGFNVYPASARPQLISSFVNVSSHIKDDTAANINNIYLYQQSTGANLIYAGLDYTKPTPSPAIYDSVLSIQPILGSTLRVANLKSFTDEVDATITQNERYIFVTATFQLSAEMYQKAVDISNAHLEQFKNTPNLVWSLLFQPIPDVTLKASRAAEGNILGVDKDHGNLMLFLLFITWDLAVDDAKFNKAAYATIADIKAAGNTLGVNVPFTYLNYAGKGQDVLGGYGLESRAKMAEVSAKYDPQGVFQKLVPGGWKIRNSAGTGD